MSANFSWVWKCKILDNCFLNWCRKMRVKNVQHSLRIMGFALSSTPSLHLHFIIYPVLYGLLQAFFIEGDPHSYTRHIERVDRGERDIVLGA